MLLLEYHNLKHKKQPLEGVDWTIVDTPEKLDEMINYFKDFEVIAFDTETTGLDLFKKDKIINKNHIEPGWRLVGISFAAENNKAFYVPLGHIYPECDWTIDNIVQLPLRETLDKLDFIWYEKKLVAHNMKYDYEVMYVLGKEIKYPYFCTMMALAVINCSERVGLKYNTELLLGKDVVSIDEVSKKRQLSEESIEEVAKYACDDAINCLDLYFMCLDIFENHSTLGGVFWNIEMPVIPVLAEMELTGVSIDRNAIADLSTRLKQQRDAKEKEILALIQTFNYPGHGIKKEEFMPTKIRHIVSIIEDYFEIPLEMNPVTKLPRADNKALTSIFNNKKNKNNAPLLSFIKLLFEWRAFQKLYSTYAESILDNVGEKDDKLHPDWIQHGARTGRLSAKKPNLMNQPSRSDDEFDIRSIYVVDNEDECFIPCDYNTVEMCIAGCLSNDVTLVDILMGKKKLGDLGNFNNIVSAMKDDSGNVIILNNDSKIDIHIYTVHSIDNIPYETIDKQLRSKYKPVGFGILYGMTAVGLSHALQSTEEEAQKAIDGYLDTFGDIKTFIEGCQEFILNNGYILTAFGRVCWLKKDDFIEEKVDMLDRVQFRYNIPGPQRLRKTGALRSLVNARIQGTAADVMKMAMARMFHRFKFNPEWEAKIVLQIHDEVIVKCKEKYKVEVANCIMENMYTELKNDKGLTMPLVAEATAAKSLSKRANNLLAGIKLWKKEN